MKIKILFMNYMYKNKLVEFIFLIVVSFIVCYIVLLNLYLL
jgi:hypothetical protein